MHKRIAIVQSNYIPWKGYFDLINMVDEFVLYDHVQYTRRDWRNRNIIKTPSGPLWLTIPVDVKGRYSQRVCDTRISQHDWNTRHWKTIRQNYARAGNFKKYRDQFEDLYNRATDPFLSQVNLRFLSAICSLLGIATKLSWSTDYHIVYSDEENVSDGKTHRLLDICRQSGATEYLSGPAAKDYINEGLFQEAGVKLSYMDYSGYPEYDQLYSPFTHEVSVLDLLFNVGSEATRYLKSFNTAHVSTVLQILPAETALGTHPLTGSSR
jgi:hypothetical protein